MTTHPEAAMTREQVQWFCQPTKSGSPTPRKWLLRFDDAEVGDCYFDNEAEAYAAFDRANIGYSCWLFATMPTRTGEAPWVSSALASTRQEPAPAADAEEVARLDHDIAECETRIAAAVGGVFTRLQNLYKKRSALRRYAGGGVTDEMVEAGARAIAANSGKDLDQTIVNEGGRATWTFYSRIVRLALEAAARASGEKDGAGRP